MLKEEIEKFVAEMKGKGIYNFELNDIKAGKKSYFLCKHNLDMDEVKDVICFRAEYDKTGHKCDKEGDVRQLADEMFTQMVLKGEIEYQNIEFYEELLDSAKESNIECVACMKRYNPAKCRIKQLDVIAEERDKKNLKKQAT